MKQQQLQELINSPDFYDQIEKLTISELEGLIYHLCHSCDGDEHQLRDSLYQRSYALRDMWKVTDADVMHLKRVNSLVLDKLKQTIVEAEQLYKHLQNIKLPTYSEFEITAVVYPKIPEPYTLEIADDNSGSDYLTMAKTLLHEAIVRPDNFCFKMTIRYVFDGQREYIDYGGDFDSNNELWDCYDQTFFNPEIDKRGKFLTCNAMHTLYTDTPYSPQDVIRIQDFESKITVEFTE